MKNRYQKLINNSIIFAIGNFGSKVMQFIMIPIYSYALSTSSFGKVDLITTVVYLLSPIISLELFDSVFRFSLDKSENKAKIFSTGLITLTIISILCIICSTYLKDIFNGYPVLYATLFLVVSMLYSLISNFARAMGFVKNFAIAGIINTLVMGLANILLLVVYNLGIDGYMLSIIIGQILGIIYIILSTSISHYFNISEVNFSTLKRLLKYGIPLIPNTLAWWLNSTSDRFFIIILLGTSVNGIYAMANKLPGVISTVVGVFFQSWQMSVVEEFEKEDAKEFISNIFESFISLLFFFSIGMLAIVRPLFRIFLDKAYFSGWTLIPFLLLAVIYTNISSFLGTIYTASKRTVGVLTTTICGAVINVILTIILLKSIGINGAAIANAISFFVVSMLRYRYIWAMGKIRIEKGKFIYIHALFITEVLVLFLIKSDVAIAVIGVILLLLQIIFDKNIRLMFSNIINKFYKRV